jgi:hypothetical protein
VDVTVRGDVGFDFVFLPVGLVWVHGLGGVSAHDADYPPFFSPSFAPVSTKQKTK